MTDLITAPNLTDADGFYEALIAAHQGLTPEQSTALNARLILLLANHVGDRDILLDALRKARETGR
ncbi:DUF2783 domain-containing protein [Nisaea nitritireducens]|uniref:DUF2783 domain-containing protein n=1 Tax=Nisaea nitritireducens TaxID=568392 RepID=UPI0018693395|nr:DUF2783 domain-containing protein [Nisaea nitritireducens]